MTSLHNGQVRNGQVPVSEAGLAIKPGTDLFASQLFVSLPEQLSNVLRWNAERGWGLRPADFQAVDLTPRPPHRPFVVDLIAIYLDERADLSAVRRTCHELWTVAAQQQPGSWSWDWYLDQWEDRPKPVCLREGCVHRPGLRRVTIDLAAGFQPGHQIRARELRGPRCAHAEVLAAAAHFPRWVRAMDGRTVPHTWLNGYQILIHHRPAPNRVLSLSWSRDRATVSLTAGWTEHAHPGWAAPVILGDEAVSERNGGGGRHGSNGKSGT